MLRRSSGADNILALAHSEADRLAAITDAARLEQVEREANEILARARAEADRVMVAATMAEQRATERREQVEREAEELLVKARAQADRVRASTDEERRRVRNLLTGALASLDTVGSGETRSCRRRVGASSDDLAGDLSALLQATATDPTDR